MKSLLDMLQGQVPESMKLEPVDIVGKDSSQSNRQGGYLMLLN